VVSNIEGAEAAAKKYAAALEAAKSTDLYKS
jgi:hypothetical protein